MVVVATPGAGVGGELVLDVADVDRRPLPSEEQIRANGDLTALSEMGAELWEHLQPPPQGAAEAIGEEVLEQQGRSS